MKPNDQHRVSPIFVLLALLAAGPAGASSYLVDRFDDSTVNTCILDPNDCALRGAIVKANAHPGDDIVRLRTGTYTLSIGGRSEDQCQTGDLDVRDDLLIVGDGPDRTVIDAAGIDRVLHVVAAGARLTVRGVTITGGNAEPSSEGGAIKLDGGALRLESCVVANNVAGYTGGVYDVAANLTEGVQIVDTWFTGNSSALASALASNSLVLLERSTISGNSGDFTVWLVGNGSIVLNSTISGNSGAGVRVDAEDVELIGCTLADNTGPELQGANSHAALLRNTLLAGTCAPTLPASLGGNLESPGNTCGLGGADLVNVADPMLSALNWFGGPTPVHRPLPGSPAVDQAIAAPNCPILDQRGLVRPLDGGGSSEAICDIGAVEFAGVGEIFVETFESGFLTPWSSAVW